MAKWLTTAALVVASLGCVQSTSEGTTTGGSGSSSSGGSSSGGSTSGATSSGGSCAGTACAAPRTCCGAQCAALPTDPANCGACGTLCPAGQSCQSSACQPSPCPGGNTCAAGTACCGASCCDAAQVCCVVTAGASTWECLAVDGGCPPGCVPPNCPISSKRYKKDISYLTDADRAALRDDLVRLPLATFRYKSEAPAAPARLGFMVEDATSPACVAAPGDRVDLYGYTTMAVATLQAQEQELRELREELAAMRARVDALSRSPRAQP